MTHLKWLTQNTDNYVSMHGESNPVPPSLRFEALHTEPSVKELSARNNNIRIHMANESRHVTDRGPVRANSLHDSPTR